jgi:hypothetical protein
LCLVLAMFASTSGCGDDDDSSSGAGGSGASGGSAATGGNGPSDRAEFSFFVTSLRALQELSGSIDGFGGDLTFGEVGEGAGLRGADRICAAIAEKSLSGAGAKTWRAFLSTTAGGVDGGPVHAIDRVGEGPWYDRRGRLVALTKSDLLQTRPLGADAAILNDLPNEDGIPNHAPDPTLGQVDNHDTLTGSNSKGMLFGDERSTCKDWTSSVGSDGTPRVGHSWGRGILLPGGSTGMPPGAVGGPSGADGSPENWMSALDEAGCAPGASLVEMGPPKPEIPTVGSGGGYGGFYCFALTP